MNMETNNQSEYKNYLEAIKVEEANMIEHPGRVN